MARYFLDSLNKENIHLNKKFTAEFEEYLLSQEWTGNVRELKNIVQRAYYMSDKNLIYPAVSTVIVEESKEVVKTKTLNFKDIERESIIRALALNKGNVIEAAEDLHISKATIYRKIKKYSIDLKEIKEST